MEEDRASATADGAAALRAAHLLGDGPYVFEDPYAIELTSDAFRELRDRGELREYFVNRGLQRVQGQIVGRARWADDALTEAVARGLGQYILIGAGLDSFVLRRSELLDRLRVIEFDHPASQRVKVERLKRTGFRGHANVEFVPVDLERESLAEALAKTAFAREQPAFVSWLGVVTYLTHDAIERTLRAIRSCVATGSELALDYPILPELLDPGARALFEQIRDGSANLGEPRRATHDPARFRVEVCALGYELIEDLSNVDVEARYFASRSDGLRMYPQIRLARFRAV